MMKKLFALLIVLMLVLGSCSSEEKIVGTWTDIEGSTWVFSSNGKITYTEPDGDVSEYKYSVFDGERRTELTIFKVKYDYFIAVGVTDQIYTIEYSKDGKTLRLTGAKDLNGWSDAGPGWSTNQLTRQSGSTRQLIPVRNSFTGTWSGIVYVESINLVIEGSTWTISGPDDDNSVSFTATYSGNTATINTINEWGETSTATVSKDGLTWTMDGDSLTFTKKK